LNPRKYLISGGGTGGHIFPAIAIANELKSRDSNAIIEFVGANDRMEMEKVPAAGYKIHGIWIAGFQRSLSPKNLIFPFKVLSSIAACFLILKRFKPDVVIGTGGFASGPLLKVACWLNIPTVIQEQNSYAGVTNKLLGKKVDKVCLGFEKAKFYFPSEKVVFTGNPVRQAILNCPPRSESLLNLGLDTNKKTILVVGGSLGARTINQAIDGIMDKLNEANIQLIWQTGKNYTAQNKPQYGFVSQFIDKMESVYAVADLIISRAGAIAITELCIVGKPVILVPSPNVAEDHQTKNAMALVEENAALLVKDVDAANTLWDTILKVLNDNNLASKLSANIKKLEKPEAAKSIADEVINLLKD
jgi:UDP-N-acetylglucosamine--N-acetylmuramyl-(pentapeptide) pyrophosphoryl-undecaprenol N-acetylglucosamine transferase